MKLLIQYGPDKGQRTQHPIMDVLESEVVEKAPSRMRAILKEG